MRYLSWLLLTKRPENIRRFWPSCEVFDSESEHKAYWPNVWIGTSVENQEFAEKRIPELLKCRDLSPVLFLSCEPLLGPVDLRFGESFGDPTNEHPLRERQYLIDWVIVGGESGPEARHPEPDGFRSLREQCEAAGVSFHFKQWGEWIPYEHRGSVPLIESQHGDTFDLNCLPEGLTEHEPVSGWWWPDGLSTTVYRHVGKKKAGRMLDGVIHDAFPAVSASRAAI